MAYRSLLAVILVVGALLALSQIELSTGEPTGFFTVGNTAVWLFLVVVVIVGALWHHKTEKVTEIQPRTIRKRARRRRKVSRRRRRR